MKAKKYNRASDKTTKCESETRYDAIMIRVSSLFRFIKTDQDLQASTKTDQNFQSFGKIFRSSLGTRYDSIKFC